MSTHSNILDCRIPWTEELGGLQPMGLQRVRHYWMTDTFTFVELYEFFIISDINPLSDIFQMLTLYQFNNLQIFFQYSRLLSLFFYLFLFLCKIFLCLVRSHLFIVGFVSFNLGDRTKKMLLQLMIGTVLPMFYFRNFMIPSFIFFYLTHLSLFLYMMWENVPISFFFYS